LLTTITSRVVLPNRRAIVIGSGDPPRHRPKSGERKRDIAHDRNVAALADAPKIDKARRHELNEVKNAARDAHHNHNILAIERRDRAHDKAVLADERAERRADVVKRDQDAAHIR
jgi:hypothetical protein